MVIFVRGDVFKPLNKIFSISTKFNINSHDSCGVGFITRKDSRQTHKLLQLANEALCVIPHRGGMNSLGVGDGAGINIDLSVEFFSKLININALSIDQFIN